MRDAAHGGFHGAPTAGEAGRPTAILRRPHGPAPARHNRPNPPTPGGAMLRHPAPPNARAVGAAPRVLTLAAGPPTRARECPSAAAQSVYARAPGAPRSVRERHSAPQLPRPPVILANLDAAPKRTASGWRNPTPSIPTPRARDPLAAEPRGTPRATLPLYAWVPMRYKRGMATRTRARRAPVTDPRRAVAYLRVSTDEQHLGPEAQRAALEAWAAREGVTVVAWHTDAGVSGAAPVDRRPALMAALADLAVHGAGLLAVSRRDRLARDVMAAAMVERLAADGGARVVSAAGEGTEGGDDPAAALMRRMVDAFAEYERAMIAARTRAAMAAKARRGEAVGHPRIGFRVVDGRPVVDPAEGAMVARAAELRASGLTLRALAEALSAEGFTTRAGGPHNLRSVSALLAAEGA